MTRNEQNGFGSLKKTQQGEGIQTNHLIGNWCKAIGTFDFFICPFSLPVGLRMVSRGEAAVDA